jgi:uncharacterized protein YdcH (DUF465 family)
MADEHLDHALSEEFGSQIAAVHRMKASSAHFRTLMERNHALWKDIQKIQSGVAPTDDFTLEDMEKRRLAILDEMAKMLAKA